MNVKYFVQSLQNPERLNIFEKNKLILPEIEIFPSINGYNIEETTNEFFKSELKFHRLGFATYGTLANFLTKVKAFKYQIENNIDYLCLLEDDVEIEINFKNFIEDHLYLLNEYNFLRLREWGEGFVTSIENSKNILKHIYNDGIIFNIDDQIRMCCGEGKYLFDTPINLIIGTNQGDCLKTSSISNNEILKFKKLNVSDFLNNKGFNDFEGNCQGCQEQIEDLINLTCKPNINVMEIGFNGGHSAETFLRNNNTLNLISFDLGEHNYVSVAKEYIDINFPNRHTLILGDSRETVPSFIQNNKDIKFDIIFIDGGHDYEIAKKDMDNCLHLAHNETIVLLDDVVFKEEWKQHYTHGPTKVWNECLEQNKIIELNRKQYSEGRGMSWGKPVFNIKFDK